MDTQEVLPVADQEKKDQKQEQPQKDDNEQQHKPQTNRYRENCDSPLLNLPTEIIFEIIKRLDFMDIVLLRDTCKQMEHIVDRYKEVCKDAYEQQQMISRAIALRGEDEDDDDDYSEDDLTSFYDEHSVYDEFDDHDFNEFHGYYGRECGTDSDEELPEDL